MIQNQFDDTKLYYSGFKKGERITESEFSYIEFTYELESISIRVTKEYSESDFLIKEYCELLIDLDASCTTSIKLKGIKSLNELIEFIRFINN